MKKGTSFEFTNVDTALQKIGEYVLSTVEASRGINELFITTDEEMNYYTTYSDYEKDEMLDDYWKFKHDVGFFETENGVISQNNSKIKQPITKFSLTGQYHPHYAAQDEPLKLFNSTGKEQFNDYRKWSDEADNWRLYVHRKPSSEFSFTLNAITGEYTLKNEAHDLDKASIDVGFGDGLQSQAFSYRVDGGDWQEGLPSSPLKADTSYEIRNAVIDFQGEEGTTIKELSRKNLAPIATFETNKPSYIAEENVVIKNNSYDPNGDDLTAIWEMKEKGKPDSSYNQFATGTLKSGTASTNWNPTINNIDCNTLNADGYCYYDIKLTVTDASGLSDTTTQTIEVLGVKIVQIPNPTKNVEGDFYWELQHKDDKMGLKIVVNPVINSVHADVKNITYGFEIDGNRDLSERAIVTKLDEITPLEVFIEDVNDLNSIKNKDIIFYVEYAYTNHIEVKGTTEKPIWEGYEEYFILANELPRSLDDLTLKLDHKIKDVLNVDSLKSTDITNGFVVGRDIVIDMTKANAIDKVKQQVYKEYLQADTNYKEKYNLKTQSRIPLGLANMTYKVSVPSQTQHNADFKTFNASKGAVLFKDIDENLKDTTKVGINYELGLGQANMIKQPLQSGETINSLAVYKFDYVSDMFFISKNTGFAYI